MKLREYQAKAIFRSHGIAVPDGEVVNSAEAAIEATRRLGTSVVLKPQLGVKGRGKVGGIAFACTPAEAGEAAARLLTMEIKGEKVERLLVEKKADIREELYLAVTIDYAGRRPVIIASRSGGVEIEEVARTNPDQVLKQPISIIDGPSDEDLRAIAEVLGPDGAKVAATLFDIFRSHDAETVEINPIVRTAAGDLVAVDGVLNINEDSVSRHPELDALKAEIPVDDPIAEEAAGYFWTYIDLEGDIGILSSGAGLTMVILDLLERSGGKAANFLDTAQIDDEGIRLAFDLIKRAKPVNAILVNIFAGLNRCDSLAEGIAGYLKEHQLDIPVVVRMIGNREAEGHEILRRAGIEPVTELEDAIEKAVTAARSYKEGHTS